MCRNNDGTTGGLLKTGESFSESNLFIVNFMLNYSHVNRKIVKLTWKE